jgi:hypothetical protein
VTKKPWIETPYAGAWWLRFKGHPEIASAVYSRRFKEEQMEYGLRITAVVGDKAPDEMTPDFMKGQLSKMIVFLLHNKVRNLVIELTELPVEDQYVVYEIGTPS